MLGLTQVSFAESNLDNSLTAVVARQTLHQVLSDIAQDIGKIKHTYFQLEDWNEAKISSNRIQYQYEHCDLLIYTNATNFKVGVYLKLKADGERAEEFKDAVQSIVARRFQKIRNLNSSLVSHE